MACRRKRTNVSTIHDMQPVVARSQDGKNKRTLGLRSDAKRVHSGRPRSAGIPLPSVTEGDEPIRVLDRAVKHTLFVSWTDRRNNYLTVLRDSQHLTNAGHAKLLRRIQLCQARIDRYR